MRIKDLYAERLRAAEQELTEMEQQAGIAERMKEVTRLSVSALYSRLLIRAAYFGVEGLEMRRQLIAKHRSFEQLSHEAAIAAIVVREQEKINLDHRIGRAGIGFFLTFIALGIAYGIWRKDITDAMAGAVIGAAAAWYFRKESRDNDRLGIRALDDEIEQARRDLDDERQIGEDFTATEEQSGKPDNSRT